MLFSNTVILLILEAANSAASPIRSQSTPHVQLSQSKPVVRDALHVPKQALKAVSRRIGASSAIAPESEDSVC